MPPHENIIILVEVCGQPYQYNGIEKYTEYFIFEFAEHELASIIHQKIIYEEQHLKCIFKQILTGLDHLHSNGVVHRDFKPANILLTSQGVIKIIDFGMARKLDHSYRISETYQMT